MIEVEQNFDQNIWDHLTFLKSLSIFQKYPMFAHDKVAQFSSAKL
jgi:hypothetical protein